jgi:hypothetical protein
MLLATGSKSARSHPRRRFAAKDETISIPVHTEKVTPTIGALWPQKKDFTVIVREPQF